MVCQVLVPQAETAPSHGNCGLLQRPSRAKRLGLGLVFGVGVAVGMDSSTPSQCLPQTSHLVPG